MQMRSLRLFVRLSVAASIVMLLACKKDQPPPRQAAASPSPIAGEQTVTTEQLEAVEQTVQSAIGSLSSRCYHAELQRRGEPVAITALLRILVGREGRARQVELRDISNPSREFEQCVDTVVRRWEFPALSREAWFTYPLSFSPDY